METASTKVYDLDHSLLQTVHSPLFAQRADGIARNLDASAKRKT